MYGALAVAWRIGLRGGSYILPAAHQRSWVQIKPSAYRRAPSRTKLSFLTCNQYGRQDRFQLKDIVRSALMGLLVAARQFTSLNHPAIPQLHYWLLLALGAMSLFMMFRFSRPLWELAPELHFVQFPWRSAVPFGVAFAFFLGAVAGQ